MRSFGQYSYAGILKLNYARCHIWHIHQELYYSIRADSRLTPSQWETSLQSDHYNDVIMSLIASQITSLTIVYSTVYSSADQRKHQSSASPAFVRVIHRGPVNYPHKGPVTRKMFLFDDVIMSVFHFLVQIDNQLHTNQIAIFPHRRVAMI